MRGKSAIALLLMLVFALTCMGALAEGEGGTTTPTEYTVTIDYQGHGNTDAKGNKYPKSVQVPNGATVGQPKHTEVAGWKFLGWYTNLGEANPYDFTAKVTENITLYAKWEELKYTVTFDANCTDAVTGIPATINDVKHGDTVPKPTGYTDPERTGYTFLGWYLESGGFNKFVFTDDVTAETPASTVTENITLYAKWQRTQYTVTFNPDNGVQTFTQTVNDGEKATKPADPVKQGFKFDGWYNRATKYDFTAQTVTENIELTAKWTKVYKVVFNLNGHGDTIKPVSVAANETILSKMAGGTVPQPTAEGYDFRGWYTNQACTNGNEFSFNVTPTGDDPTINLYAKWTARVTVSFNVVKSVTGEYDDTHPKSVQLQLYEDGVAKDTVTFQKSGDKWVVQGTANENHIFWQRLPDKTYTVREVSVPDNFTEVCTRNGVNNYTITNVPKEKYAVTVQNTHAADTIDIMVSKIWDDNNNKHRPEEIQVKVSWNDNGTPEERTLTLNKNNNWTATLPGQFRRAAGQIIQYVIEEINNPAGYKATCDVVIDEAGNYSVRIVNVLTGKMDIDGTKFWDDDSDRDGIRPESVQLKIYENAINDSNLVAVVIVDSSKAVQGDSNRWKWTVQDLPIYDKFDRPITYIIVEDPVPEGYTASAPQYITWNENNNPTNN